MTKVWYKSKTHWFNIFNTMVLIASMSEVTEVLPPHIVPWVAVFGALGNLYLRSITKEGVSLK